MRGAGVGLTRTKENDMTGDTYGSKETKAVIDQVHRNQLAGRAYLGLLMGGVQDDDVFAIDHNDARIYGPRQTKRRMT
jgi:2-hydroxy-3-keto-5-methylthiopentenyl-1-phosphate phosphatase